MLESTAAASAGVRAGRGMTTYYLRTRADAFDAGASVPGVSLRIEGAPDRAAIVELTRDAGGLRELAFRTAGPGVRGGQVVESVARLDLRDPANRAAAEPLLAQRLPWPPAVARELRALVRRAVAVGVVERAVYDVRDGSDELKLAAKLGHRARGRRPRGGDRPPARRGQRLDERIARAPAGRLRRCRGGRGARVVSPPRSLRRPR